MTGPSGTESEPFVGATEIPTKGRDLVRVPHGCRVFLVTDELASRTLFDWSKPVRMRLQKVDVQADPSEALYDLIMQEVVPATVGSAVAADTRPSIDGRPLS